MTTFTYWHVFTGEKKIAGTYASLGTAETFAAYFRRHPTKFNRPVRVKRFSIDCRYDERLHNAVCTPPSYHRHKS